MAKKIKRLNSGQAPSLLNTQKANELIDKINELTDSSASAMAELAGISLKVSDSGKIELDITQEASEILTGEGGGGGGIPEGFVQQQFGAIVNGTRKGTTFLVKIDEI